MTLKQQNCSGLYLIPNALHNGYENLPEGYYDQIIPKHVKHIAQSLKYWLVENPKNARAFLNSLNLELKYPIQQHVMLTIDKNNGPNKEEEYYQFLFHAWQNNYNVGLLSEAGLPAIADPGSSLVALAYKIGLNVYPLVGPCSITLALMASGLVGQCFTFHGYLPLDNDKKIQAIKNSEQSSQRFNQTQICIETPYRNISLAKSLLQILQPSTKLCIASELTLPTQKVICDTVHNFKNKSNLEIFDKKPSIFLWQANT